MTTVVNSTHMETMSGYPMEMNSSRMQSPSRYTTLDFPMFFPGWRTVSFFFWFGEKPPFRMGESCIFNLPAGPLAIHLDRFQGVPRDTPSYGFINVNEETSLAKEDDRIHDPKDPEEHGFLP